jgi:hypothetical protein
MKQYQPVDGEPFCRSLREVWSIRIPIFQLFNPSQQREGNSDSMGRSFTKCQEKHKLDDSKIPGIIVSGEIDKMISLGENKCAGAVEWSWEKQMRR